MLRLIFSRRVLKTFFILTNDRKLIFNIESPYVDAQRAGYLFKKTFVNIWFKSCYTSKLIRKKVRVGKIAHPKNIKLPEETK